MEKSNFPNRMAKCRAKKKGNPETWALYLERDRERKRLMRAKIKELPQSVQEQYRKAEAARKALSRKKLKKQRDKKNQLVL